MERSHTTVLHESLTQLATQAPDCDSTAMARGVLAEADDLLRNAALHEHDAAELGAWFSTIVIDVLNSPALRQDGHHAQFYPSGAFGRREGLVDSRVRLLTWGTDADQDAAAQLLSSTGLTVRTPLSATSISGWMDRARAAILERDADTLGLLNDAGTWGNFAISLAAEETGGQDTVIEILRKDALDHRPPAVVLDGALPTKDATFDIRAHLVIPVARLARWAGFAAGARTTHTPHRLTAAATSGILTEDEAMALNQAWVAGMKTYVTRWAHRTPVKPQTWEELPPIQRTLLSASCREVAFVARSISSRYEKEGR